MRSKVHESNRTKCELTITPLWRCIEGREIRLPSSCATSARGWQGELQHFIGLFGAMTFFSYRMRDMTYAWAVPAQDWQDTEYFSSSVNMCPVLVYKCVCFFYTNNYVPSPSLQLCPPLPYKYVSSSLRSSLPSNIRDIPYVSLCVC